MTCCDNQQPRISERTGRMFCASCLAFLDARPKPLTDERPDESIIDATEPEAEASEPQEGQAE